MQTAYGDGRQCKATGLIKRALWPYCWPFQIIVIEVNNNDNNHNHNAKDMGRRRLARDYMQLMAIRCTSVDC